MTVAVFHLIVEALCDEMENNESWIESMELKIVFKTRWKECVPIIMDSCILYNCNIPSDFIKTLSHIFHINTNLT